MLFVESVWKVPAEESIGKQIWFLNDEAKTTERSVTKFLVYRKAIVCVSYFHAQKIEK